jgi:hypothetical protein
MKKLLVIIALMTFSMGTVVQVNAGEGNKTTVAAQDDKTAAKADSDEKCAEKKACCNKSKKSAKCDDKEN